MNGLLRRICILAYDGLEIDLVEKFDLPNLKQEEYGKTSISDFNTVSTPILWGSFITGKYLEPYFMEGQDTDISTSISQASYKFLKEKVSANLAMTIRDYLKEKEMLETIRGKYFHLNVKKDLKMDTIFDAVDDSIGINVPAYTQKWRPKFGLEDILEGHISDEGYLEGAWSSFEKTKKILMENLNKDLVMAWVRPADHIGHVWRGDDEMMLETYEVLDKLAEEVKEKFEGLVMVISDHGQELLGQYGDHSNINYGFYSVSEKVGFENPKITDFYDFILKGSVAKREEIEEPSARKPHGDEKEEIKKRLRDLGYF